MKRCSNCGFRSDLTSFFRRERGGVLGLPETVCEGCSAYRPTAVERRLAIRAMVVRWVCVFPVLFGFQGQFEGGVIIAALIAAAIFTVPLRIGFHELGHALAGRLVGRELVSITIGSGPRLYSRRLGRAVLEVNRRLSGGGGTHFLYQENSPAKWRDAIVYLGGPSADIASAVVAFWLCSLGGDHPSVGLSIWAGGWAGVGLAASLMALANLFPARLSGNVLKTDGRLLLELVTGPERATRETRLMWRAAGLIKTGRFDEAADLGLSAQAGSEHEAAMLAIGLYALSRAQRGQDVIAWYRDHFDRIERLGTTANEDEKPVIGALYSNVAWNAMRSEPPRNEQFIDRLCQAATAAAPAATQGLRGSWMVTRGQFEPGMPMLSAAIRASSDWPHKGFLAEYLAVGARAQGDEQRATAYEALSRRLVAIV